MVEKKGHKHTISELSELQVVSSDESERGSPPPGYEEALDEAIDTFRFSSAASPPDPSTLSRLSKPVFVSQVNAGIGIPFIRVYSPQLQAHGGIRKGVLELH